MVKLLISKITPGDYKKLSNFKISYGSADTKFGKCFIADNNDKICFLSFVDGNYSGLTDLKKIYPKALFTENNQLIVAKAKQIFDDFLGEVKIFLKGTEFQIKVWEELVHLPKGTTCSYEDIAKAIGNPKAIRAVANAVAKNNISYAVPCHRVINKGGGLGKYHWGVHKKLQILKYEKAI